MENQFKSFISYTNHVTLELDRQLKEDEYSVVMQSYLKMQDSVLCANKLKGEKK